ncbi:MAG TPA: AMIN domain-containing protein [Rugosimonospora sp.]|jgi:hypothetical protein
MLFTLRRTAMLATAALAGGIALFAPAAWASATGHDLSAPTSTAPVTGTATAEPSGPTPPVLTGVRTGRHATYDRTVFDFTGGTPGYRVEYGELRQEGTGALVPLAGAAHLHVEFTGAYTRDPSTGAGTFNLRTVRNPGLPTLRQIKFGGEFEAHIAAGLGLTDRVGFRAFTLANPPRVVVDVAHQPSQPFRASPVSLAGTAPDVLVDRVRSGRHPGYDRLVFDIEGSARPELRAGYAGTGSSIDILFTGQGSPTTSPHASHAGPSNVYIGLPELRGVSFTVIGAGMMTARVSTAHRHGFRVMVLTSPTRVVLDVAH